MKRSKMKTKLGLETAKWLRSNGLQGPNIAQIDTLCENILSMVEEQGMLPPTNTCKLIPDDLRGGIKHSPTKREWDDEEV